MQKANYTNTATASGGQGKYPLSTQTLDFIQQQVMILQLLGYIGGSKYILRQPDGTNTGLVFIDGEVLTLAAKPTPSANIRYINVTTKKTDIKADGETYTEARVYRTAALSSTASGESYEYSKFAVLETNQTLGEKIKQVPQTVLGYLEDILAEKMPLLTKEGVTQAQLDALTSPCVLTCTNSIKIGGCANYGVEVLPTGTAKSVRQTVYLPDGKKYTRYYNGSAWVDGKDWKLEMQNLNIECMISSGTVMIRHGKLPEGCKIIMLRKKRRSRWRSTGGGKSLTKNIGKRIRRSPKRQYVHYKGVVLQSGSPETWYSPHCTEVADSKRDSDMLGKELGGLCRPFITQKADDADGNEIYRMTGVRNKITAKKGSHTQNSAYTQIGIQIVNTNADGSVTTGGNILKLKYHLRRQKKRVGTSTVNDRVYPIYKYVYYRSFSIE